MSLKNNEANLCKQNTFKNNDNSFEEVQTATESEACMDDVKDVPEPPSKRPRRKAALPKDFQSDGRDSEDSVQSFENEDNRDQQDNDYELSVTCFL